MCIDEEESLDYSRYTWSRGNGQLQVNQERNRDKRVKGFIYVNFRGNCVFPMAPDNSVSRRVEVGNIIFLIFS